jgi:hypothetical protein
MDKDLWELHDAYGKHEPQWLSPIGSQMLGRELPYALSICRCGAVRVWDYTIQDWAEPSPDLIYRSIRCLPDRAAELIQLFTQGILPAGVVIVKPNRSEPIWNQAR